ncbi:dihydroxyacetone kinase subunit DhaL [Streptococcus sciuri]|uniref:Dihydroxyacetone kinase subunit DhaL n=1 Tax=Streptococcus sciuri TaxID=2973939 RepID=A0ABT2F6R6_9STRE|nr:dihydroxyacetone kinase subunit DhaL [Streptococcus sciuri]MCS4488166.1 dihydroxyacetone kinase subunit DhaL [Streptococcus sciuri]
MNVQDAIKWMSQFNDKIQANKDYLSELDRPIGDGDHGSNMARGMAAVMEELTNKEFTKTSEVFKTVGMQLLSKVGGASGSLYGSAFVGISKGIDTQAFVDSMQDALDMIIKRGKATVGEKTMVDVWTPVIQDLRENKLSLDNITAYVETTKDIVATKGRASYVGERSLGHLDPGSQSTAYLFEALIESGVAYE